MGIERFPGATPEPDRDIPPPVLPKSSTEFITLLAHYHRAEIARMAGWRDRIDRTTNWAITVVGAMLSISLSTPSAHHGVMLFAMLLVMLLLHIEARRYRFFDVYRGRVRRLERNYFAHVLSPAGEVEHEWRRSLADDLRRPSFMMSRREAMSRRLRRNYGWMLLIVLLAWLLKITSAKLQPRGGTEELASSLAEWFRNAEVGPVPGWLVMLGVAAFYGWLAYVTFVRKQGEGELAYGNAHV